LSITLVKSPDLAIARKESSSFLKKEPKNFCFLLRAAGENRDSELKVFCFFSSEKKTFLPKAQAQP
jgi:hypothetical protein